MSLAVRDLSIRFGGVTAVANTNLEVQPREIVGLIGPNGAGKTTFINCIAGVNRSDTGSATWNGREIHGLTPAELLRIGVARTFQSVVSPHDLSVLDGAAAHALATPGVPTPVYRFMFSDEFAWGYPPKAVYLDAHLHLLGTLAPRAPWMVAGLGVDIGPLIEAAVTRGGHVRVGLEDAPWNTLLTNRQWVEDAARRILLAGRAPAGANDVRAALAQVA